MRYAPGFGRDLPEPPRAGHPYTAAAVADFLGWREPSGRPAEKVHDALGALALIEEGVLTEAAFTGLSRKKISRLCGPRARWALTAALGA
jgi:hypothetical protein